MFLVAAVLVLLLLLLLLATMAAAPTIAIVPRPGRSLLIMFRIAEQKEKTMVFLGCKKKK